MLAVFYFYEMKAVTEFEQRMCLRGVISLSVGVKYLWKAKSVQNF